MLERKVYVNTGSPLYPNLYVFLVGKAGTGKTRAIMAATAFVREIPEINWGPTSMTMASMVDTMEHSKRVIIQLPDPPIEYNTMYFMADELSAAMSQYDPELIAGLTTFFDGVPYAQSRRTKELKIKIARPQLNMLAGSTPSNLIKTLPEAAWEQGFTSRAIMIFSNDKPIIDIFDETNVARDMPKEMIHDLKLINNLVGSFGWTKDYSTAMHNWKQLGYPPVPRHPKLEGYCARRFSHLIKLSMVASIDRSSELLLTKDDFNKAMGWLLECEHSMAGIFSTGSGRDDSAALREIKHFVEVAGKAGVSEHLVIRYAKDYLPVHAIKGALEVLISSGDITPIGNNPSTGLRVFAAIPD